MGRMTRRATMRRLEAGTPPRWPSYAAAVWGFVFALPSFYWALGGTAGAASTISPQLVELARQHDPGFIAVLWVTGVLKVVGGMLGLALARPGAWGRRMSCVLQLLAWGAGVLLVWHGALFIGQGFLVQAHIIDMSQEQLPIIRWYTYVWGPWFLAGGIAFILAARAHLAWTPDRRAARTAALVGGLGAVALSAAALLLSLG